MSAAPTLLIAGWTRRTWDGLDPSTLGSSASALDILLTLLIAFVCGQVVAWTYSWTHRGLSYSREFVQSLILVAMIVAMVMVVVGDSLARAFGLVGALAIIRFRTTVRDTRDIAFVFLALAAGIAAGSGRPVIALLGTPAICAVAAWLTIIGFGGHHEVEAFLRLRLAAGVGESDLTPVLARYCRTFALVSVHTQPESADREHSFQLQLHDAALYDPLIEAIDSIDGVMSVNLLLQENPGPA